MSVRIEKQKQVENVSYQELVNILRVLEEKDQKMVHIMMFTDVRMKKRGVPTEVKNLPTIKKLSSRIYRLSIYGTRVNTERGKDEMEKDFVPQKLNGRTKVSPFVYVSDSNDNVFYLGVEPFEKIKGQFDYYSEDFDPITDETELEMIKQYQYQKSGKPKTQVQTNEVRFITPKIENIWKISLNGIVYVRNDI